LALVNKAGFDQRLGSVVLVNFDAPYRKPIALTSPVSLLAPSGSSRIAPRHGHGDDGRTAPIERVRPGAMQSPSRGVRRAP